MALETREPWNLEPGEIYHAAQTDIVSSTCSWEQSKNYVLVLRGFVLELEQILKNDRLRVGQGRIACSD